MFQDTLLRVEIKRAFNNEALFRLVKNSKFDKLYFLNKLFVFRGAKHFIRAKIRSRWPGVNCAKAIKQNAETIDHNIQLE